MFKGTRVPVRALIATLQRSTIEEFYQDFPTVSQGQAETVLLYLSESLIEDIALFEDFEDIAETPTS